MKVTTKDREPYHFFLHEHASKERISHSPLGFEKVKKVRGKFVKKYPRDRMLVLYPLGHCFLIATFFDARICWVNERESEKKASLAQTQILMPFLFARLSLSLLWADSLSLSFSLSHVQVGLTLLLSLWVCPNIVTVTVYLSCPRARGSRVSHHPLSRAIDS